MDTRNTTLQINDGIAILTVDRQPVLNALDRATLEEIDAAVGKAASSNEIAALIITGAGPKAFVAGADIKQLAQCTAQSVEPGDYAQPGDWITGATEGYAVTLVEYANFQ